MEYFPEPEQIKSLFCRSCVEECASAVKPPLNIFERPKCYKPRKWKPIDYF